MKHPAAISFMLLMLLCASYAASYGYSRVVLQRSWEIESGAPFDFTGALAVNDSNQRIVSFKTEPRMDVFTDENGTLMLHYNGSGTTTLRAEATIDIDYDPQISSDPSVPKGPAGATPLTEADANIANEARELSDDDSALATICNLVNWVHDYVTYDISYWGKSKSAIEVYRERRGVCVEYTHLLISLARSLGFQARYVSGYVYAGSWQPHAWAEIYLPGHGWLPADATFSQAGVLDSSHLAVRKSDDQSASYDLLLSHDEGVDVRAQDSLETSFESADPKGVTVNLDIDKETYVAEVTISNGRPGYALGSYSFLLPESYGGEAASVALLRPNSDSRLYHGLNRSMFQSGFLYTIPVAASFNDARDEETLSVNGFLPPNAYPDGGAPTAGGGCASFALPLLSLALALSASMRRQNPVVKNTSPHSAFHGEGPCGRRRAGRLDCGNKRCP